MKDLKENAIVFFIFGLVMVALYIINIYFPEKNCHEVYLAGNFDLGSICEHDIRRES